MADVRFRPRVLLALELLKHELGASDEDISHRFHTDLAVMHACGLRQYQAKPSQAHFVLPETLCEFRSRINKALMGELIAMQARCRDERRVGQSVPSRHRHVPL